METKTGDAEPSANWGRLLTAVMEVRLLSAEPVVSNFGILSGLLVNEAAAFTSANRPHCRERPHSKIWKHRGRPVNDGRASGEVLSISVVAARLVNTNPAIAGEMPFTRIAAPR
jgi:hypothetical protein